MSSKLFNHRYKLARTAGRQGVDLHADIKSTFQSIAALQVDEWVGLEAADPDAILLARANVMSPVTLGPDDFDGVVGSSRWARPRDVTITTTGDHGSGPNLKMDITLLLADGTIYTYEDKTVAPIGATQTILSGVVQVLGISLNAAGSTNGTIAIGFGNIIGLKKRPKRRAGVYNIRYAVINGVAVDPVDVVEVSPSTGLGTFDLSSDVPDGVKSYAVCYEFDPEEFVAPE